jgi:predicted NBD/HSP70 family sugar kinase
VPHGYAARMAVIALDIGGTWTRIAAGGVLLATVRTLRRYDSHIERIAGELPGGEDPAGVSFCGRVTGDGTVRIALNLPDFAGRPLGRDLAAALGRPVRIAHDATCGLLGEALGDGGALHGVERGGYLTLSTGVGAAVRLGDAWLTTEAGHQLVPGNDRPCGCGQTGCLQTLTGGDALARRLGRPLETVTDAAFWDAYAGHLAYGVANFALAAGLERVALGGAIALRAPLWPALRSHLARIHTYQPAAVVPAALGDAAPLAGAAVLATGVAVLH